MTWTEGLTEKVYFGCPRFIQEIGINIYEFKNSWMPMKSSRYRYWYSLLKNSEKWSRKNQEEFQNRYVRTMVNYAYDNVPYYRKTYEQNNIDVSKIKRIEDLERLPILTKDDIRGNHAKLVSQNEKKFIESHTSGTTGTPLSLMISQDVRLLSLANGYGRRFVWANYDGSYVARFVGDKPVKNCNARPIYRKDFVMKRLIFPSYCLSFDNLEMIIQQLTKLRVKYLQAYPSTAYIIAKFLELKDEYLKIDSLFYSSEPLLSFQKDLIKTRLQTKLYGYYGQAEHVVSAMECEKGNYHLTIVDGFLEVVDGKGERIYGNGKGFVVATSLHNKAMPFIRYFLGDFTGYMDSECECGRQLPLIYPIESKCDDFIVTSDGRLISPSLMTFPFKHSRGIIESQIIQKSLDRIIVRIVKTDEFKESEEKSLLLALKSITGEMNIRIEYATNIHQTNCFKKRWVINEIGDDYLSRAFYEYEV